MPATLREGNKICGIETKPPTLSEGDKQIYGIETVPPTLREGNKQLKRSQSVNTKLPDSNMMERQLSLQPHH